MTTKKNLYDFLEASYLPQKIAKENISQRYGFEYDPNLSSMETKVFVNQPEKEIILTHRGSTRVLKDWIQTDVPLAFGFLEKTGRYKQAKSTLDMVKEKYPEYKKINVGHSLGGSLSRTTGGDENISFNPGIGLGDVGRKIKPNEKIYRNQYDVVSSLSKLMFGDETSLSYPTVNPISIHSIEGSKKIFF